MDEEKYITGFNSGYLMSKTDPERFKLIMDGITSHGTSDYIEGMKAGQKEFEKERMRQIAHDRFKEKFGKDHTNDNELNRDR